jgi:TRAP-type uncharacterized transport system substrate-binding protein
VRTDADMVHNVVRAIVSAGSELGRLDPLFAGLCELLEMLKVRNRASLEFDGVELHAGAVRAYTETNC